MDYGKLLDKYNILLKKVDRLTKENRRLKTQLRLQEPQTLQNTTHAIQMECVNGFKTSLSLCG